MTGDFIMTLVISGKAAELEQAPDVAVEGEIREFVRRDGANLRRSPEMDSELVANNISTLLQRVAGTSVQEIDRLIAELQTLRDLLHEEGARVQREIAEYAHLSQSAMQSTKIIAESLGKWKTTGEGAPRTAPRGRVLHGAGRKRPLRAALASRAIFLRQQPVARNLGDHQTVLRTHHQDTVVELDEFVVAHQRNLPRHHRR